MDLAKHISDLLFKTDRVVVPGLGVFSTKYIPAQLHTAKQTFQPPSMEILFTSAIKDDNGLLIRHIAEKEGIKEEIAKEEMVNYVNQYNANLTEGKKLKFINIGTLSLKSDGTYVFKADKTMNYLGDAFGMKEINEPEIIRTEKKKKAASKKKTTKAVKRERSKRPAWIIYIFIPLAAIIVLGVFNYDLIIESFNKSETVSKADEPRMQSEASYGELSEQQFIDTLPEKETMIVQDYSEDTLEAKGDEVSEQEVPVPEKRSVNNKKYYIVAGSFRSGENAMKLVEKLKSKAYNSKIFGMTPKGLQMVSYESFENKRDAIKALNKIVREENASAWIIKY